MPATALLIVFTVAALATSNALADPGRGKGKAKDGGDTTTTAGERGAERTAAQGRTCRRRVSVILKGIYVSGSADASGSGSFSMTVARTNKHARGSVGTPITIAVNGVTRLRREGDATLSDFVPGDRLKVQVRTCKGADAPSLVLLARRVVGRPARPDDEGEAEQDR